MCNLDCMKTTRTPMIRTLRIVCLVSAVIWAVLAYLQHHARASYTEDGPFVGTGDFRADSRAAQRYHRIRLALETGRSGPGFTVEPAYRDVWLRKCRRILYTTGSSLTACRVNDGWHTIRRIYVIR